VTTATTYYSMLFATRRMRTQVWFVSLVDVADEQFWREKKSSGRDESIWKRVSEISASDRVRRGGNYTCVYIWVRTICALARAGCLSLIYSRSYLSTK